MLRKLLSSVAALIVLSFTVPVMATPTITGSLDYPNGVDIFAINITNFADFSAISGGAPFGVPDTELFLFSASWLGVYANDDDSGGNTLACLPSADASNPCSSTRPGGVGPTTDGLYYLAITRSANSPLSVDGDIFTFLSSTDVVGPDLSMGGGSPLTGWDDGVFTGPDFDLLAFNITLTGAVVLVPEPATWILIAIGLVLVLARRRQVSPR
jgi:PEP-CTERM motif